MELLVEGWRIEHMHYADRSAGVGPAGGVLRPRPGRGASSARRLRPRRRPGLLPPLAGAALPREPGHLEAPHRRGHRRADAPESPLPRGLGRGARALPGGALPSGRRRLRGVVPVNQVQSVDGLDIALVALERHEGGARLRYMCHASGAQHAPRDAGARRDRGRRRRRGATGWRPSTAVRGQPPRGRLRPRAGDPVARSGASRSPSAPSGTTARAAGAAVRSVGVPDPARAQGRPHEPRSRRSGRGRRARGRRGARPARGARPLSHRVPARPRPDPPHHLVPAAEAQDAGLRGAGGRPLPHPPDPHPRGVGRLAHRRPGAPAQRGPGRGHRHGPRPGPRPLRPRGGGRPRRPAARAPRPPLRAQRPEPARGRGAGAGRGGPQPDPRGARRHPQPHRPAAGRPPSRARSCACWTAWPT